MPRFDDLFKTPKPTRPIAQLFKPQTAGGNVYGRAALTSEANKVASAVEGTRNDTLNSAAFNIAQLVASGHLEAQHAYDTLLQAALQAGLPELEAERTLKSGGMAGSQHPRVVPDLADKPEYRTTVLPASASASAPVVAQASGAGTPAGGAAQAASPAPTPALTPAPTASASAPEPTQPDPTQPELISDEEAIKQQVLQHLPIINWHELWADTSEEDWILYPLIPYRRGVALYSPPKVGKSLLMLEIAAHIAEGSECLGATPDRPHNVLYVDFENDPKGDIRPRLQAMGFNPERLTGLKYLSFPVLAGLDTEQGAEQLLQACRVYTCDLVVIDTISRAVNGEENENDTWLSFYKHTGLKLKQAGIAMVRLDHTGKDLEKGQRGGSAKAGDVDAIWKFHKVTEDGSTLMLSLDSARMSIGERKLVLRREPDPLRHAVNGAGPITAWEAKVNEVIKALDELDAPEDIGRNRARELLREHDISVSTDCLREAIRQRKQLPQVLEIDDFRSGHDD
ncbi:AAA family ATPase [Actinotignum schaalii]|uniref:AAA family ATPase n=1 Tax=Actinotignum TaxID=1653174 RepID=UPI00237D3C0C|nr:AAA family ATPase [Actinotignum sanguinis]MDE1552236.1 AAA family ATPase [Actinotignum sanguinis]